MVSTSIRIGTVLGLGAIVYIVLKAAESIYTWIRIHMRLKHLPRPPSAGLLGVPQSAFTPRRHSVFAELSRDLGSVFYCRILWVQVVFIADPVLATEIYSSPQVSKTSFVYEHFAKLLGGAKGEREIECMAGGPDDPLQRLLRKGLAPSFSINNVRKEFGAICKPSMELVEMLRGRGADQPVEMTNALMCATLDTIGAFGLHYHAGAVQSVATTDKNPLIQALKGSNEYVDAQMGNPALGLLPFLPLHATGRRHMANFHAFTRAVLDDVLARGSPAEDDTSVAAQLQRISDEKGQPLTYNSMQAQLNTIFWGGHDTTGLTMSWTLYLVATNPQVEASIVRELGALGLLAGPGCSPPRELEFGDLNRLPYLTAVLKESMRLAPVTAQVGPRIARKADVKLSNGLVVPRGTVMMPMTYIIHRHPDNWSQPDRFIPERWLEGEGSPSKAGHKHAVVDGASFDVNLASRPGLGFIPFSEGRRDCIGKVLAHASMLATLACLLGSFHFRVAERMGAAGDAVANSVLLITLQPPDGMWLHACPRA